MHLDLIIVIIKYTIIHVRGIFFADLLMNKLMENLKYCLFVPCSTTYDISYTFVPKDPFD